MIWSEPDCWSNCEQQRLQLNLMVHQLRNPLAALRTYAQLLLRRLGPDSDHRLSWKTCCRSKGNWIAMSTLSTASVIPRIT